MNEEQVSRVLLQLERIAKANERIADSLEALTQEGACLDTIKRGLDDIEQAIREAGGQA